MFRGSKLLLQSTPVCACIRKVENELKHRNATTDKSDDRGATRNNGPAPGGTAHAISRECHNCHQWRENCSRDWRIAVDGLALGRAAARIGRACQGPPAHGIFSGESAGHSHARHAAPALERQLVWEAHL